MKIKQHWLLFFLSNLPRFFQKKPLAQRLALELSNDALEVLEGGERITYPLETTNLNITSGRLDVRVQIDSLDIDRTTIIHQLLKHDVKALTGSFTLKKEARLTQLCKDKEARRQRRAMLTQLLEKEAVVTEIYQFCIAQFEEDTHLTSQRQRSIRKKLDTISALLTSYPTFTELDNEHIKRLDFLKRIKNQTTECFKRKNKELEETKAGKKTADSLNIDAYESDEKSKTLSADKA
jgi:hypothetical protein